MCATGNQKEMMIARQTMDPTARFFLKESSFFGVFI